MRFAEQMYDYCVENEYGRGTNKKWGIKHFKVIEDNLMDGEEVYMAFIGLKDYISMTKHDNNYAYAITNKRIAFAQKKLMGENFKSVVHDKINDISSSTGIALGIVVIDTLGEKFNVGVDKKTATNISKEAQRIIFGVRDQENSNVKNESNLDPVAELRKYKELLEDGIINEQEFENKKKELL